MQTLADEFLAAQQDRSTVRAVDVVSAARASGAGVWDIASGVLAPAQREVGLKWERDEWSVAHEHAATVIAELALSSIRVEHREPARGRLVAACPSGEWHAVPVSLVVEGLRELDWDVVFLGASVPADQLGGFLREHRPDAFLLGVSMAGRLPAAGDCIDAARSAGVPTLLGGSPVGAYPRAAARLGAHGGPADAPGIDDVLRGLVGRSHRAAAAHPEAGRRCNAVVRTRLELCAAVVAALQHAHAGDALASDHWELLRISVGELVDVLAAAALLEDVALVGDFISWLEGALAARDLPVGLVAELLHHLEAAVAVHAPSALDVVRKAGDASSR